MKIFSLALITTVLLAAGTKGQTPVCHVPGQTKAATKPARLQNGFGKIHMPITTESVNAQAFFDQGLALLHSFWFYEADRSFAEAARLDPECAMAQWGIAMAGINDSRRDQAVTRAAALSNKVTERERLYIAAVAARYEGQKEAVQNNPFLGATESYRGALRRLVAVYPDDLEAKLFLALALLSGYERDGRPKPGTAEAIALCKLVLAKEPSHPAAHHYLIHAFEASRRPQDAVASADVYGSLVPAVGHAVHMPGHIYVHINRWDDAARVFEASAEADRKYMRDEGESSDHTAGPYSHNLHFLATVYGYQGRYRGGVRVAQELLQVGGQPGEATSRAALEGRMAMLRMLVRFERWDDILDGKTLPDGGGFAVFEAWRHYALGLGYMGKGNLPLAHTELEALEREISRVKNELPKQDNVPQRGVQVRNSLALAVAPLELKGRILAREGNADEGIVFLRHALEEEIKVGYSEPPLYPHPMEEVLGQALLTMDRWPEAETVFGAALARDPGSGRALFGLVQALEREGKRSEARLTYLQFLKAWARADNDLPEMRRAKAIAKNFAGRGKGRE
jgi:tetratricopeptide (TPR) repeat protein